MKFSAVVLASAAASASADVLSGSRASKLIQQSRRVNEDEAEAVELAWATDFSVKYQGCHHIKQWNNAADGADDVRMLTKRLVRYRMCPSEDCSASKANGCQSGYGDYIVDMDTYLSMYWEAKQTDLAMGCQNYVTEYCGECDEDDDAEVCQATCLVNGGMEDCVEDDNAEDGEQQAVIDVEDYFECVQIGNDDNDNDNNNGDNNQDGQEYVYYAGPYCSEQGGAIKIGVFTDDQCTEFAGKTFYQLTGQSLAYTEESIVEDECRSCKEVQEYNGDQEDYNDYNGDQEDGDEDEDGEPRELCGTLYQSSGKCETYLGDTVGEDYINENACNYMNGIRMVRTDGLLDVSDARPSAVATAFIVIFAMAFAAMAFYVWYLRTRLGVKKNSLL
eukprot:CAMPEP_0198143656 /NCGR_PEP_ID=MMETSP1443-20131203/8850_1 /TAXON_ID=186043 /ORGANISM="Entomoneis sp., Strain CCMP2396" /LENGTH=388 /DNA_ID=CAMNT_0043806923 /DNA_START=98 /DNA_END=1264 /DNA_ORIENTATION=-